MKKKIIALAVCCTVLCAGCSAEGTLPGTTASDTFKSIDKPINKTIKHMESELQKKIDQKEAEENKGSTTSSQSKPTPSKKLNCSDYGLEEPLVTIDSDNGDKLILVNKKYAVSSRFKPINLVKIDGSLCTNQGQYLKSEAYSAYKNMLADAKAQGFNIKICSAYRTYDTQRYLFTNYVKTHDLDYALISSAFPGRSEHHTGLALDVTSKSMGWALSQNFINYPDGKWINDNCANYGFIIRYPQGKTDITGYKYEPWHLRYVGVDVATDIMSRGITLEEYLGKI